MTITTTQSLAARLALLGTLIGGTLTLGAAPAQARSFLVVEPGRAQISAGLVQCEQFIMERDGAEVVNFQAVPRIEKEVVKAYRYRDKKGNSKVGTKKVPAGVGISNTAQENKQWGGRNANARVSTGTFQKPSAPWTYTRHLQERTKYRCVAIVTALVKDASGKLHHRRGVRVEGPWVNSMDPNR